jgi:uncharacterized protein (TIGR00288 family)
MKPQRAADGERTLAVFIDFENLALGFGNRRDKFSIEKVLERLVEKGKIVAKRAYADWSRFGNYASSLHASAVELVEIPKRVLTGKNSADIRMCVDAMDLAYSKDHIDTFVIVSGDSDFSPLVSKLKELGKHLIGLGLADSTSDLLRDNCDEFIYYEDLDRVAASPVVQASGIPEAKQKAFTLVLDALQALRRENKELILPSMVKDTIKRKKPSFNEEYHGYRTFTDLLEDAQRYGLLELDRHKTSGTYMVARFGGEMKPTGNGRPAPTPAPLPPAAPPPPARSGPVRGPAEPAPRPAAPPPPAREPRPEPTSERGGRPRREPAPREAAPVAARPPARPATPKPPLPEPEERVPLGRALIDDLDDDLDEVPSYRPRKPAALPPAAKEPAPVGAKSPAAPRTRAPKAEPAASPPVKPAARPRAEAKPAADPKPTRAAPPTRLAAPKPAADPDDFGAGLDV